MYRNGILFLKTSDLTLNRNKKVSHALQISIFWVGDTDWRGDVAVLDDEVSSDVKGILYPLEVRSNSWAVISIRYE